MKATSNRRLGNAVRVSAHDKEVSVGGDFVSNKSAYQVVVGAFEDQPRQFSRHLFAGGNPRLVGASHLVTRVHRLSPAISDYSSDYPADIACRAHFMSGIRRELITEPWQKRILNLEAAFSTFAPQFRIHYYHRDAFERACIGHMGSVANQEFRKVPRTVRLGQSPRPQKCRSSGQALDAHARPSRALRVRRHWMPCPYPGAAPVALLREYSVAC